MAEYIEREAAIEKLNKLCDRVCQYSKAQRKYMCGACPLGHAFTVIEDDIPAADVRPVEWIPVTERLPEDLTRVIVFCEDGVSYGLCEHLIADDEEIVEWHDFLHYPITPTHWMPLPQPPKEE